MNVHSMEPLINKGESIHIEDKAKLDIGDIALLQVIETKEFKVRRYLEKDKEITLKPENSNYRKEIFKRDEILIWGRVCGVTKKF
ncbi:MAG: hypothetical protein A2Y18_01265 [Clostridiales bacterium GWD2_32_19]|nr:MAG: hypothetical protein A2Y18_01265 [Clostridiales bacterium GWD2_32_19]